MSLPRDIGQDTPANLFLYKQMEVEEGGEKGREGKRERE